VERNHFDSCELKGDTVPQNYQEPGVLIEQEALKDKAARRDESRPAGVPFTTPQPKTYAHMEADKNPVSHESDEVRAVGKPFVQAPPASGAERAQCEGKEYPRRAQ
jgi:hypothetical protein